MRHSPLTNETDGLAKFKKNIDEILLQIKTLSKTEKSKAFSYVYKNLQLQESVNFKNKLASRGKAKLTLRQEQLMLVKKGKLKTRQPLKCPVCKETNNTKVGILKHLESSHVDVPLSCLKCRKTFNSQISYLWHIPSLCGRRQRTLIKRFKCHECSKEFSLRTHLLLHQAGHKKNNCELCKAVFTRRNQLEHHLVVKHNAKRTNFNCDYCQRCFIKRRSLYLHLQNHLTSEFVCVECGNISKCLTDHQTHELEHAKRKPWHCPYCNAKFTRRQVYFTHLNRHERYKCLTCKESFSSKPHTCQHKVDALEPQLYCSYCQQQFSCNKLLQKHVAVHHESLVKLPCQHCNNSLDQCCSHKRTAEKAEAYICEHCGQQYDNKYRFDKHLVKDHNKTRGPYSCEHCNYTSKFKPNITRHMSLHFIKKKQFVCDHCGKFFSNVAVLTDHIKYVHTQNKVLKCSLCEKSFKRNTELTRHQSTHSNLRPYNCGKCSNSYKQISHLRRHEKNIHGIVTKTNKVQPLALSEEESDTSNQKNEMLSTSQETLRFDFRNLVVPNELPEMSTVIEFVTNSTPINHLDVSYEYS